MTSWLSLSDEDRKISLQQASAKSGIVVQAVEKDWWVTLVLKALFELQDASHFIFKGGTSLSKGWNLINRFSEDLDIALSPEAFGMEYRSKPSKDYRSRVKKEGCQYTSTIIKAALQEKLQSFNLYAEHIQLKEKLIPPTFPDTDPQEISISYRSLFEPLEYIEPRVKVEFSVRSLKEPFESIKIQSILWQQFPQNAYKENAFSIIAATPHKTFIEKMFLLHEKFITRKVANMNLERQSRHLYDLVQLSENDFHHRAMADMELYHTIVEHRRHWIKLKGVNYNSLLPATLSFIPPDNMIDHFRKDYDKMTGTLLYGKTKNFNELIKELKEINHQVNLSGS